MAQQTIGIGTAADDGTGDDLRTGGDKINDNFTELYTLFVAALTSQAALTPAADRLPYFTGASAAALATFTAAARSLLDDASFAAMCTTLGLGTGDSPQFTAINVGHASDTTLARAAAGALTVEGQALARVFSSTGIPFGVPSSGTMGNNGALSGLTAFGLTYPSIYLWLPANAISAGSAAGWYYTVMSSTTAGTVYNNTYTSGVPTIPGSPTAFVTTGPGAYTQSTATNITGITLTVPADSIGPNGFLRVTSQWSMANTAGNKTHQVNYGGTNIMSRTDTTGLSHKVNSQLIGAGATNAQLVQPSNLSGGWGSVSTAVARVAIDTTASQTLYFRHQLAVATDYTVCEGHIIELAYGP